MTCLERVVVWGFLLVVVGTALFMYRTKKHGVWPWGISTAAIGAAVLLVIVFGWPPAVYWRIKESANAIGAVVAASALAWSWFYQNDNRTPLEQQTRTIQDIQRDIKEIKERMSK